MSQLSLPSCRRSWFTLVALWLPEILLDADQAGFLSAPAVPYSKIGLSLWLLWLCSLAVDGAWWSGQVGLRWQGVRAGGALIPGLRLLVCIHCDGGTSVRTLYMLTLSPSTPITTSWRFLLREPAMPCTAAPTTRPRSASSGFASAAMVYGSSIPPDMAAGKFVAVQHDAIQCRRRNVLSLQSSACCSMFRAKFNEIGPGRAGDTQVMSGIDASRQVASLDAARDGLDSTCMHMHLVDVNDSRHMLYM